MTHPRLRGQQASGDFTTDRDISPEQVNTGLSTPPHLKTNQHNVFVFTLPLFLHFLIYSEIFGRQFPVTFLSVPILRFSSY